MKQKMGRPQLIRECGICASIPGEGERVITNVIKSTNFRRRRSTITGWAHIIVSKVSRLSIKIPSRAIAHRDRSKRQPGPVALVGRSRGPVAWSSVRICGAADCRGRIADGHCAAFRCLRGALRSCGRWILRLRVGTGVDGGLWLCWWNDGVLVRRTEYLLFVLGCVAELSKGDVMMVLSVLCLVSMVGMW